jgi:hypothetical protein
MGVAVLSFWPMPLPLALPSWFRDAPSPPHTAIPSTAAAPALLCILRSLYTSHTSNFWMEAACATRSPLPSAPSAWRRCRCMRASHPLHCHHFVLCVQPNSHLQRVTLTIFTFVASVTTPTSPSLLEGLKQKRSIKAENARMGAFVPCSVEEKSFFITDFEVTFVGNLSCTTNSKGQALSSPPARGVERVLVRWHCGKRSCCAIGDLACAGSILGPK